MTDLSYTLRVTEPTPEELDQIVKSINKLDGACIMCREIGSATEKPHIHAVVHTTRKLNTVRQTYKRMFDSAGNGKYSLKACYDPEGMARYVCKDGDLVTVTGMWRCTPAEYQKEYADHRLRLEKDRLAATVPKWLHQVIDEGRNRSLGVTRESDIEEWGRMLADAVPVPTPNSVYFAYLKIRRVLDPEANRDACARNLIRSVRENNC